MTEEEIGEALNKLYRAMFLAAEPGVDLRKDHDEQIDPTEHVMSGELYQRIISGWVDKHHELFPDPKHRVHAKVQYMLMNNGPSVRD